MIIYSSCSILIVLVFVIFADANTVTENSITYQNPLTNLEWWQRNVDKQDPVGATESQRYRRKFDVSECNLSPKLKEEIHGYQDIVDQIVLTSTNGTFKRKTYDDLATFVDTHGSRLSGTEQLEEALSYLQEQMVMSGLDNVHGENVTVPKWIRGEETAYMISPRFKKLEIKGLGFSIPTPAEGLVAEVLVVDSFKDLQRKRDMIKGKILAFCSRGGEGGLHALVGASMGAKYGAIAVLSKSPTSFSLYSPHTGVQFYDDKAPKVPVAALTVEDADMIFRLAAKGEKVVVNLKMDNIANTKGISRNVIGDLTGREKPEEYVVVSGHADSWDVGDGALDDGVGPILSLQVVNLLKTMNLQPKRTIRTIAWTAEEAGLYGVRQWMKEHQGEMGNYSAAMEADYGCLKANGLLFSGSQDTGCILNEILTMLASTNANELVESNGLYTDIYGLTLAGVPGIVLDGDDGRYFWYHHTEADTMTPLNPAQLDLCLAVWASTSYVIADLNEKLPR